MNLRFNNWVARKTDSRIWLGVFFIANLILVVSLVLLATSTSDNRPLLALLAAIAAIITIILTYFFSMSWRIANVTQNE